MTTPDHLGGALEEGDSNTWMPDIWGYFLVKYRLESVIDIGCGFGHACKWFADYGLRVMGVDGWNEAIQHNKHNRTLLHDFTKGPLPITEQFDLALSLEFLEHVEEKYLPNVMSAFQLAKYVCVTHAEPGQGGRHHVTERESSFWIAKFTECGFRHDEAETALLRKTDRWKAHYGRKTLLFFTK